MATDCELIIHYFPFIHKCVQGSKDLKPHDSHSDSRNTRNKENLGNSFALKQTNRNKITAKTTNLSLRLQQVHHQ